MPRATRRPTSLLLSCGCLSRYVRVPSEPPRGFRIVVALTSAGQPIESSRSRRSGHRPSTGRCRARRTICTIRAFIARARPSHHLCRASDETGPAPTSITRPARRRLEASPWWAPSRLPVVTRRLTDLASRGAPVSRKTSIRDHKGIVVAKKNVSEGEPSRGQTGLHSRSSDLMSELQSFVRSDEVVIATEQLHVLIEPLRRASVGKRSSRKVCRALPDGQIQPLDKRRVQCRGVLGVIERVFESPCGSVQRSPFDFDDTIVPARLEDLAVERGCQGTS